MWSSSTSEVVNTTSGFSPRIERDRGTYVTTSDAPPSSLCDPKRVQRVGFAELVRNLVPLTTSSTKRGRGVVLEALGLD
jgi:hypothetical protein